MCTSAVELVIKCSAVGSVKYKGVNKASWLDLQNDWLNVLELTRIEIYCSWFISLLFRVDFQLRVLNDWWRQHKVKQSYQSFVLNIFLYLDHTSSFVLTIPQFYSLVLQVTKQFAMYFVQHEIKSIFWVTYSE